MTPRLVASLVLAALALAFVLQNVAAVEVRFLFWSFALSTSLLLLIVLVLGIAIGWLWGFSGRRRQGKPGSDPDF